MDRVVQSSANMRSGCCSCWCNPWLVKEYKIKRLNKLKFGEGYRNLGEEVSIESK